MLNKKENGGFFFTSPGTARTLFTSDWHIGADTWGRDRRDELKRACEALALAGKKAGVENVVVGGDIFDSFRYPGREDLRFAASLFSLFIDIPSVRRIIAVGGNHDWNDMGVWPDMMFAGHGDAEFIVSERPGIIDAGRGWISVVPHIRRHAVRGSFEETVSAAVPGDGRPVLLCAHMALEGTMPMMGGDKNSEPQMTARALENYGPSLVGAYFGHIHKTAEYGDYCVPCRYIGTPMRITFGEERSVNGGWIADFDGNALHVPVPSRELLTIRAREKKDASARLAAMAGEMEAKTGGERPYIRIIIESGEKMSTEEIASAAGDMVEDVVATGTGKEKDNPDSTSMADFTIVLPEGGKRNSVSVSGMLLPYFEENLQNPELAPEFASIGTGLLEGTAPEELWRTMKASFQPVSHSEKKRDSIESGRETECGEESASSHAAPGWETTAGSSEIPGGLVF